MIDQQWLDATAAAFDASLLPEVTGVIALTILGGPDGDVPTIWRYDGGLRAEIGEAADDTANVSLTIPWNDAMAVLRGDLAPAVTYMQGKLKGSGDMTLLLTLVKESASPAFETWRKSIAM